MPTNIDDIIKILDSVDQHHVMTDEELQLLRVFYDAQYEAQAKARFNDPTILSAEWNGFKVTSEAWHQWRNLSVAGRTAATMYIGLESTQDDGSIEQEDMDMSVFPDLRDVVDSWKHIACWSALSSDTREWFINNYDTRESPGSKSKHVKDMEMKREDIEKAKRILSYGTSMVNVPLA